MTSDECSPCHSIQNPKMYLEIEERTRIFTNFKGTKVLGLIIPIENEPKCSNADCHAHPGEQNLLGVIDVQMSLKSIDQKIKDNRKSQIITSLFITFIISIFSDVFIWIFIHTRVSELIKGTNEISKGNYNYRINIKSNDERRITLFQFN